jgi:hypothetical protein
LQTIVEKILSELMGLPHSRRTTRAVKPPIHKKNYILLYTLVTLVVCITRLENAILQVQARFVHKCEHLQNIF